VSTASGQPVVLSEQPLIFGRDPNELTPFAKASEDRQFL
jgi:hypothetical protein